MFQHRCQPQDDLLAELAVRDLIGHLGPFTITRRVYEQERLISANRIRQLKLFDDQARRGLHGRQRPDPDPGLEVRIPAQRSRPEVDADERRTLDVLHAPPAAEVKASAPNVRTDINNNRGHRA